MYTKMLRTPVVNKLWSCCATSVSHAVFNSILNQHVPLQALLTHVWQTAVDKLWSCCYVHSCFTRFTQLHAQPAPFFTGAADTSLTYCCQQTLIQLFVPQLFHTLYGGSSPVLCMDISSDSTIIATGAADKNVKLWGLDFGDLKKSLFAHDDRWVRTCILFFLNIFSPRCFCVFQCGNWIIISILSTSSQDKP